MNNSMDLLKNKEKKITNFYSCLDRMIIENNVDKIENYQFLFKEFNEIIIDFFDALTEIKKLNYISNVIYFKIKEYLEKFLYLLEYLSELKKFSEKNFLFKELLNEILHSLNNQKNEIIFFIETTKEYLFTIAPDDDKLIELLNDIKHYHETLCNFSIKQKNKEKKKIGKEKIKLISFSKLLNKFKLSGFLFKFLTLLTILFLIYFASDVFANIINELLVLFVKHV